MAGRYFRSAFRTMFQHRRRCALGRLTARPRARRRQRLRTFVAGRPLPGARAVRAEIPAAPGNPATAANALRAACPTARRDRTQAGVAHTAGLAADRTVHQVSRGLRGIAGVAQPHIAAAVGAAVKMLGAELPRTPMTAPRCRRVRLVDRARPGLAIWCRAAAGCHAAAAAHHGAAGGRAREHRGRQPPFFAVFANADAVSADRHDGIDLIPQRDPAAHAHALSALAALRQVDPHAPYRPRARHAGTQRGVADPGL